MRGSTDFAEFFSSMSYAGLEPSTHYLGAIGKRIRVNLGRHVVVFHFGSENGSLERILVDETLLSSFQVQ